MAKRLFLNAKNTRRLLNLYPPLLFSGIEITDLSDNFMRCRARLKDWKKTRNFHGSQFGGSLFAITDIVYATMLHQILGKRYFIWDQAAKIDFIKPGFGEVYIDCHLSPEILNTIETQTAQGEKYLPTFNINIMNREGEIIARAERTLYIRLKPEFRP